ncbi:MAG: hypothetical protein PUI85_03710 [Eubacteriales bacterium]|nr:hypothetical protein [Eubacteriales bacterium]MDY3332266.1 hypothetical protein [Gallibacter sp.]
MKINKIPLIKLPLLILSVLIVCSLMPKLSVNAQNINSKIMVIPSSIQNTVHEYDDYINQVKTIDVNNSNDLKRLKQLNTNLSDGAKNIYRRTLLSEINNKLSHGISIPSNTNTLTKEFVLSNGETLKIEATDIPEKESNIETRASSNSHTVEFTGYKDYGSRKYTSRIFVHSLVDGRLILETTNHYKISNAGLNVRYVSGSAYTTVITLRKMSSSFKVTDSSAPVVGHDINVEGYATARTHNLYGIPTGIVYHLKADNRVDLLELDKKKKRARVKQHVYAYMWY